MLTYTGLKREIERATVCVCVCVCGTMETVSHNSINLILTTLKPSQTVKTNKKDQNINIVSYMTDKFNTVSLAYYYSRALKAPPKV